MNIIFIAPPAGLRVNAKSFLGYTPGGEGGPDYSSFPTFYGGTQFLNAECLPVTRIEVNECVWGINWRQVTASELEREAEKHYELSKVLSIRANKKQKVITTPWHDDAIQFPRLLSEILAAGLPDETMAQLCASMDLKRSEILEILVRADRQFEEIKQLDQMEQIKENAAPPQFPPGLYKIEVDRVTWSNQTIVVDFNGEGNPEHIALDIAGNFLFGSPHASDYEVESSVRIGDRQRSESSGNYYENEYGDWFVVD